MPIPWEWSHLTKEEHRQIYDAAQRYYKVLEALDGENAKEDSIKFFLSIRPDLDYEPFTGKVKWEPTGYTSPHGYRIYDSFDEAIRRKRKPPRLPVDPEFYSFDMINHAYKMRDFTAEEYLENVRRKVAFENDSD